ncbi:MAG TPA: ABC transporter ATP-binding protein [Ktedonobacterales bacterium]
MVGTEDTGHTQHMVGVSASGKSPNMGAAAALKALDVRKSLPLGRERIDILKGISLRIEHGELVAIVGPSGSGKSTLLGIIAGLDSPTSGRVYVDGVDVTSMGEGRLAAVRNQKIGMVFQAFNLIPTLTAQENVEIPLYVGKHPGSPAARARELLALVGLSHRLGNKPNQLSGGEQQRVAVARALATHPAIVIMDEPTGNLDRANSENVLRMIRDLRDTTGTTFIIATHDPTVAAAADRAIRIVDGSIAANEEHQNQGNESNGTAGTRGMAGAPNAPRTAMASRDESGGDGAGGES